MDHHLHLLRYTVQAVRRRLSYFERVPCSTCSNAGLQNGSRRKYGVFSSKKAITNTRTCHKYGDLSTYQDICQLLTQHTSLSGRTSESTNGLRLHVKPKNREMRRFNLCLCRHGQEKLSRQSSKGGLLPLTVYHCYKRSFGQGLHASSVRNFNSNRWLSRRLFSASTTTPAVLETDQTFFNHDDQTPLMPHQDDERELNIRERLQLWDAEHRAQMVSEFNDKKSSTTTNLGKYDQTDIFQDTSGEHDVDDAFGHTYEGGDIVDLGNQRPFLLRGDMVELRASNCFRVELAIFVRSIGSQYQYYTMSGKWINQESKLAKYCVPQFVDGQELEPLLDFLPSEAVPEALQDKLQSFEYALPRDVGSPLIKKMLDFWKSSDKIYRETALELDTAHRTVANKYTMRRATLTELAHELLPERYLKGGKFPDPVLYALHRSLILDELGFRPQKSNHRFSNEFEISPACEIESVKRVGYVIRRYLEYLADSVRGDEVVMHETVVRFLKFIKKARSIIQESRKTRPYTPYGMIGPTTLANQDNSEINPSDETSYSKDYFDRVEQSYIRFIASWAALRTFQNHSYLHGAASAILRATGMYDDTVLDQRVGWTFLQEVGAVAPWENPVHFDMRLPSVTNLVIPTEQLPDEPDKLDTNLDLLHGLRKDWGDLPVYCIDNIGASEIDDGISVELTDVPDEYWIHVHVADPASMIKPQSAIAQNAQSAMRTIYLPDRVIRMLPTDVVHNHLSLGSDRRCLTFSARVNLNGVLLDTKITPGVLHNVLYLTPATFQLVIGEPSSTLDTMVEVGVDKAPSVGTSHRQMLESHEFTELHQRNLKLLHILGKAQQLVSLAKGKVLPEATYLYVSVTSEDSVKEQNIYPDYFGYTPDPYIQMKFSRQDPKQRNALGNTVMNIMLLAGVAAARWCQERGVPVINRVSQPLPGDVDPREYFRRMILPLMAREDQTFGGAQKSEEDDEGSGVLVEKSRDDSRFQRENVINPRLFEDYRNLPLNVVLEYERLLGSVVPSTTPGVHLHLGLDMFTRITSPLRRYSDMLAHWQIEAALLEEARSGKSLIGSTEDSYLPFTKKDIDRLLPAMERQEKDLLGWQRHAQRAWILQLLLRAWQFKEALLPTTFELWVHTIGSDVIKGELSHLGGQSASFPLPVWLSRDDVQIGDVFEVKLSTLDTYNMRLGVEPLRLVRRTTKRGI